MKRLILIILLAIGAICLLNAQDQTVNGNLTVATPISPAGGGITIGKFGYGGTLGVPVGAVSLQYNIDFPGYRDVVHDQIGARISALRINNYQDGYSGVQNTALAFFTNDAGVNPGTTDLIERMRIAPNGNVGIGTNNPQALLDVGKVESNVLSTVLGRIPGGGLGTYVGLRNYESQPADCKTFALEHHFYGVLNNSINFYRGGGERGGWITLSVHSGSEDFKFSKGLLDVNGTIHAKEVKIDNNGWADFVFDKDYKLPSLAEVEAHIQEHKRLPEIPSEAEVKENGVDVGEMQVKLLQKVEELTLYVIQQQKELEEVKKENKELRELINNK